MPRGAGTPLEKEIQSLGLDPKGYMGEEKLDAVADVLDGCENAADVLAKVGAGLLSVQSVVQKLRGKVAPAETPDAIKVSRTKEGRLTLTISWASRTSWSTGPSVATRLPGDEVVGYRNARSGNYDSPKGLPKRAFLSNPRAGALDRLRLASGWQPLPGRPQDHFSQSTRVA